MKTHYKIGNYEVVPEKSDNIEKYPVLSLVIPVIIFILDVILYFILLTGPSNPANNGDYNIISGTWIVILVSVIAIISIFVLPIALTIYKCGVIIKIKNGNDILYSDNYIFTDDSLYDASRVRDMILNTEHEAKRMYEESKDCCSKYKTVMEKVKL